MAKTLCSSWPPDVSSDSKFIVGYGLKKKKAIRNLPILHIYVHEKNEDKICKK